jgi:hypothetical protein
MSREEAPDLAATPYVNLTTYRRNGTPVTTPVWIVTEGGQLYVLTEVHTGKAKRARATGRVQVVPCNGSGRRSFGAPRAGLARVVTDPAQLRRVNDALERKYGRWLVRGIRWIYWLRGMRGKDVALELHLDGAA